jgi:thiosulfate/3-mercaptopyruvate sulfurtransferase
MLAVLARTRPDAVVRPAPGAAVGTDCGSAVNAAHQVLALDLAGFPAGALYVDSWSGWIADPGRPITTGAQPE